MWRYKDDNETPIISWSWKLRVNTWIKMEFCLYLVRDRLIQNKGLECSNTEMKLRCQKILRKYIEDDVFLGFFVCISTVCFKCVSLKGKKLNTNKYTNVGKRRFNLNREANYRPQSAFDDSAEERLSVVMFAFLSIFSLGFLLLFIVH